MCKNNSPNDLLNNLVINLEKNPDAGAEKVLLETITQLNPGRIANLPASKNDLLRSLYNSLETLKTDEKKTLLNAVGQINPTLIKNIAPNKQQLISAVQKLDPIKNKDTVHALLQAVPNYQPSLAFIKQPQTAAGKLAAVSKNIDSP